MSFYAVKFLPVKGWRFSPCFCGPKLKYELNLNRG